MENKTKIGIVYCESFIFEGFTITQLKKLYQLITPVQISIEVTNHFELGNLLSYKITCYCNEFKAIEEAAIIPEYKVKINSDSDSFSIEA